MAHPEPWAVAWRRALYGPSGFFVQQRPLDHFRTSVAVPLFSDAVRRLARRVDRLLGCPDPFDVVDLGAGGGELLGRWADVPPRWRLHAVEHGQDLPGRARGGLQGLVLAHELLDAVPVTVLEGDREVVVDGRGVESRGGPADPADLAWRDRWWPGGGRVEVGRERDALWAAVLAGVARGCAVAVDYGHVSTPDRIWGGRRSSLVGYAHGATVPPVPDGSCDLTAHVALDAVADAARAAGAHVRLRTQREALARLGVSLDPGGTDVAALTRQAQAAQLLDPSGPGAFGWLVCSVGVDDPLG